MTEADNARPHRSSGAAPVGARPQVPDRMWPLFIAGLVAVCGIALALFPIVVHNDTDTATFGDTAAQVYGEPSTPATTTDAESLATWEQSSAVAKAKDYLSLMAFSKSGLIDQLEYEGFSTTDATCAVTEIEATGAVDWNAQAVKKARDYRSMMAFSRQGLIEQLEYDGFTPAQAVYGVDNA
ncbi:Ltp family lipoprotein [Gordonia McavH-238-E]|uniref:Ltp family lipoprotein n=1 Tax=Gordonia sp. McavH-238-E TaxID=2917736 RepID=UPI001EF4A82E|nr:Ltp family lipoprotein [Gordonia sp. McavH-238-E]MCG7632138.1 Ltp family lipoprotein [Gordonia sp. McavH-238-E]